MLIRGLFYLFCLVTSYFVALFFVSLFFQADSVGRDWFKLFGVSVSTIMMQVGFADLCNKRFVGIDFNVTAVLAVLPYIAHVTYVVMTGDRSFFMDTKAVLDFLL